MSCLLYSKLKHRNIDVRPKTTVHYFEYSGVVNRFKDQTTPFFLMCSATWCWRISKRTSDWLSWKWTSVAKTDQTWIKYKIIDNTLRICIEISCSSHIFSLIHIGTYRDWNYCNSLLNIWLLSVLMLAILQCSNSLLQIITWSQNSSNLYPVLCCPHRQNSDHRC